MSNTTFLALATGVLLSLPAHAATIVQNGSFEDFNTAGLNGSGWGVFTSIPGWTRISGAGIEIETNPTLSTIDAHDGRAYVELDSHNNSAMAQSVALGVGRYELTFWYSPRRNTVDDNGIDYSIAGISGTISGPSTNPFTAVGLWTEITTVFTVGVAGTYNLVFGASGANNSYGGLIDSVSISAVPVPAAGFMILGAFGGLAALRRRRRSPI